MQLAKLSDYFEEREDSFMLRTPVSWHRKRGLVFLLAIPFLALVCGGFCGGGMLDGSQAESDMLFVGVFVGVPVLLAAGAGFLGGVIRLARAQTLSSDSEVHIDLQRRVLRSKEAGELPLSAITALELVQPSKVLQWRAIQARLAAGPSGDSGNPYQASAAKTVVLLRDIEPVNGPEAAALMERLGERMGKPTHAAVEMTQPPQASDRVAVSCHIPVQMLWAIFSLINLKNGNPLVRYHARLSLLLGGLHLGAMLGLGLLAGLAGAVLGEVAAVLVFLLLLLAAMGMLALRIVAMWNAWKKRYWQPPFLKGLTSKWLPETQD